MDVHVDSPHEVSRSEHWVRRINKFPQGSLFLTSDTLSSSSLLTLKFSKRPQKSAFNLVNNDDWVRLVFLCRLQLCDHNAGYQLHQRDSLSQMLPPSSQSVSQ